MTTTTTAIKVDQSGVRSTSSFLKAPPPKPEAIYIDQQMISLLSCAECAYFHIRNSIIYEPLIVFSAIYHRLQNKICRGELIQTSVCHLHAD